MHGVSAGGSSAVVTKRTVTICVLMKVQQNMYSFKLCVALYCLATYCCG